VAQDAAIRQKVEVRFEKGAAVRFISHHDLMRAFQRAVLRAGWPVRLTAGFNPRPRVVFPVALETGVVSLDEAAEIELTQWIPLNALQDRLARSLPPGIKLLRLVELPLTRAGRQPERTRYLLELPAAGLQCPPELLEQFLARTSLPFTRLRLDLRPPQRRKLELRPLLLEAELDAEGNLALVVSLGGAGSARPLELLSLLLERPLEDLRGVRVTRTHLWLETSGTDSGPVPTPESGMPQTPVRLPQRPSPKASLLTREMRETLERLAQEQLLERETPPPLDL
jgi:radical SAM-linked protein